jgi:hypothetical protein
MSPSRHVQDTGRLPTFGRPGWLIAPVAALAHDRATLALADPPHPGSHAPPVPAVGLAAKPASPGISGLPSTGKPVIP